MQQIRSMPWRLLLDILRLPKFARSSAPRANANQLQLNSKRFLTKKIPGVFRRRFPGDFILEISLAGSPENAQRIATSQDSKRAHLRDGHLGGLLCTKTNEWLRN